MESWNDELKRTHWHTATIHARSDEKPKTLDDMSKEELVEIIKRLQAEIERLTNQLAQSGVVCVPLPRDNFLSKRVKDAKPRISIS